MGKRSKNYRGPGKDIKPSSLQKYEERGNHVGLSKIDGMWVDCIVGNPAEGRPNIISSRDADTAPVAGSNLGDLGMVQIPWPEHTAIVGELEAATEWATGEFERKGYRSIHVFDVVAVAGQCTMGLTWEKRRELLGMMYRSKADLLMDRFPVIEPHTSGFLDLYEREVANGGEGVVLWDRRATYLAGRGDGGTDALIRCKQKITKDYVLFDLARTPSGVLTGEWALFIEGRLTRTMQAGPPQGCPPGLFTQENIGRLVVEFEGAKVFKSGAFRHAAFVRVRTDKPAAQCTL